MLLRTAVLERSCICEMVQLSLGARAAKHSEQSSNLCALVNGGQHLCLLFFSYECWVVFQRFRKESPFFFGFDAVKIESSHSLANIKYLLVQISVCEGVRPYHFFFFLVLWDIFCLFLLGVEICTWYTINEMETDPK